MPWEPAWGRLRSEFLKEQGYDGMIIREARLPQPVSLGQNKYKEFDDYFIAFDKKSVTLIED